jgi:serine carboxypeptidase-like clade 1
MKDKYRLLKFSGDTDGAVPTKGTIKWIEGLNLEVIDEWRPFFVKGLLGGYLKVWDGITLGTVHGAGHMAPQFKPPQTYHLVFNWLKELPI